MLTGPPKDVETWLKLYEKYGPKPFEEKRNTLADADYSNTEKYVLRHLWARQYAKTRPSELTRISPHQIYGDYKIYPHESGGIAIMKVRIIDGEAFEIKHWEKSTDDPHVTLKKLEGDE